MEYQAGLETSGTRSGSQRLSTAEKKRLKRARRAARKAAAAQSQSECTDQGQGGSSYRHSAGPHHPLLPPSANKDFDDNPTRTHAPRAGPHPDFATAAAHDPIDTVASPLPTASQKRAADIPADQGQAKRRRMLVLAIDYWSFLKELAGTAVGCSMGWALGWLVEDLRKTTGAEVVLLMPEASDREEYRWQCMVLCSEHDMTLYTADRQAMLDVVYKAEHPAAPSILKVDICTFERSKNPDKTPAAPRPVSPANGALWTEHTASIGRPYYFNRETGQSLWEKPVELLTPAEKEDPTKVWTEHARADGRVYYFNKLTQVSTWTVPEVLKAARDKHTGTADGQPPADDFQVAHWSAPTTIAGASILTPHGGSPDSATASLSFLTRPPPLPPMLKDSVPPSSQLQPRQVLGRLDGNGLSDVVKARSPDKVHGQATMPIKEAARVGAIGESALEKGGII